MNRIQNIQTLLDTSCAVRRSSSPSVELVSLYYSINVDGSIVRNTDIVQATLKNPLYILCYIGSPNPNAIGSVSYIYDLVAITNNNGQLIENIPLKNWRIEKLHLRDHYVANFTLVPIANSSLSWRWSASKYGLPISDLWALINGIDESCLTTKEVDLYLDYFRAKKDLTEANLSLEDYKLQVANQNNIIDQYKELLSKFQEIIDGNDKISKT